MTLEERVEALETKEAVRAGAEERARRWKTAERIMWDRMTRRELTPTEALSAMAGGRPMPADIHEYLENGAPAPSQ